MAYPESLTPDPQPFAAAAPRPRRDGWTPGVQTRFIAALAAGGSVTEACRHVGRSPKSAYLLRRRPDAGEFAAAWDAATAATEAVLVDEALERCVGGWQEPVFYRGKQVGFRTRHDIGLLMFMLRRRELANRNAPRATTTRAITASRNYNAGKPVQK